MHRTDKIRTVKIKKVNREAIDITTLYFEDETVRTGEPGQYIMVWVPRSGAIGLGIGILSYDGKVSVGIASDLHPLSMPSR